jgi:hypothetical protein
VYYSVDAAARTFIGKNVLEDWQQLIGGEWEIHSTKTVSYVKVRLSRNGGSTAVVDLPRCTAVFFYPGITPRRAVYILCGDAMAGAQTAACVAVTFCLLTDRSCEEPGDSLACGPN